MTEHGAGEAGGRDLPRPAIAAPAAAIRTLVSRSAATGAAGAFERGEHEDVGGGHARRRRGPSGGRRPP